MPDVTISFTEAQWTRVVAATPYIKMKGETGDVDADYLSAKWKDQVGKWVEAHEKQQASVAAWE